MSPGRCCCSRPACLALQAVAFVVARRIGNYGPRGPMLGAVRGARGPGRHGTWPRRSPPRRRDGGGGAWGLRHAGFLLLRHRVIGRPEEGRHVALRATWSPRVFLGFFLAQGLLAALLSAPFLLAVSNPAAARTLELRRARRVRGRVRRRDRRRRAARRVETRPRPPRPHVPRGLWGWSRHPNYFFEGSSCGPRSPLAATPAPWGALGWTALAVLALLIVFVTGIPPTEAQALRSRGDDYRAYQREGAGARAVAPRRPARDLGPPRRRRPARGRRPPGSAALLGRGSARLASGGPEAAAARSDAFLARAAAGPSPCAPTRRDGSTTKSPHASSRPCSGPASGTAARGGSPASTTSRPPRPPCSTPRSSAPGSPTATASSTSAAAGARSRSACSSASPAARLSPSRTPRRNAPTSRRSRARGAFIAPRGRWAQDVNAFALPGTLDRVASVEMFEHVADPEALLARVADVLRPGGRLFVHVFAHRRYAYPFEDRGPGDWMARHFFTGGWMPSHDAFARFRLPLRHRAAWWSRGRTTRGPRAPGSQNLDAHREALVPVLESAYGAGEARRWHGAVARVLPRVRACSAGTADTWGVSHHVLAAPADPASKGVREARAAGRRTGRVVLDTPSAVRSATCACRSPTGATSAASTACRRTSSAASTRSCPRARSSPTRRSPASSGSCAGWACGRSG